jgi:hypothetical protein
MQIAVVGDGRRYTVTRTPVSMNGTSTISPPAIMNANSPAELSWVQLQPGNIQIYLPNYYTPSYPFFYVILSPPTSSTNGKSLKGVIGDQGISLVPNLPVVLAIGPNTNNIVIQSQVAEQLDIWVV